MGVQKLVSAVNAGVPMDELKPHNCHEAVLGWLLRSKISDERFNVDAWLAVRALAKKAGSANPKQVTGEWMGRNIYHAHSRQVAPPFGAHSLVLGDVLSFGQHAPHHSMVVVRKNGTRAFAMGFNNAGVFGQRQRMVFDGTSHEVTDGDFWDSNNQFKGANGGCDLFAMDARLAATALEKALEALDIDRPGTFAFG